MLESHRRLYAELATSLGLDALNADEGGAVQITIGTDLTVVLFVENEATVTVVAPVMRLPTTIDYACLLWLLRRNHYDSSITPFRVSCNRDSNLTVWGRVPIDGLSGEELAALLDNIVLEVTNIRNELDVDPHAMDDADKELAEEEAEE